MQLLTDIVFRRKVQNMVNRKEEYLEENLVNFLSDQNINQTLINSDVKKMNMNLLKEFDIQKCLQIEKNKEKDRLEYFC